MPDDHEPRIVATVGHSRPLAELPPHLREFIAFLDEFNKETARGVALTAAAFLDDILADVIKAFLIPNDSSEALTKSFNAPLGTLNNRIAACHALGLISDREYKECDLIRRVRNEFAHKVHMSFRDDRVRSLCDLFTMSVQPSDGQVIDSRGKFTSAAVSLLSRLTNRPYYVREKPLKYGEWKI